MLSGWRYIAVAADRAAVLNYMTFLTNWILMNCLNDPHNKTRLVKEFRSGTDYSKMRSKIIYNSASGMATCLWIGHKHILVTLLQHLCQF